MSDKECLIVIAACIFYAANGSASGNANSDLAGRQKAAFIDSLFLCFSAMTYVQFIAPRTCSLLDGFEERLASAL